VKTNKKIFSILILGIRFSFFNGCIEQKTKLNINEEGLSDIEFEVIADKSFAGDDA